MAAGGLTDAVKVIRKIADQNPQVAEDFILNALYLPPPHGFEAAIDIGENMVSNDIGK
jgi:hypothetical protein